VEEDEEGIDLDEAVALGDADIDGAFNMSLDGISVATSSAHGGDVPSPSSASFYELRKDAYARQNSAEETESSGMLDGGLQVDDLEFAYDWGLGLAGKMSIPRALELAKWAAAQCRLADAGQTAPTEGTTTSGTTLLDDGTEDDEESASGREEGDEALFEAPLLELQDALAMLQRGARRSSTDAVVASDFDGPVADLQKVLSMLGQPPAMATSSAPEPAAPETFAGPMADLQDALTRLQPVPETGPTDVSTGPLELSHDADGSAGALADLQEALARLQGSSAVPVDADDRPGELGAREDAGAQQPGLLRQARPDDGLVAAGVQGSPAARSELARSPLEGPAAVSTTAAPAPAATAMFLSGPLGAPWGSAQALIRRKYIASAAP